MSNNLYASPNPYVTRFATPSIFYLLNSLQQRKDYIYTITTRLMVSNYTSN